MARYKEYNYSQGKFIPVYFDRQILPGTFEYTLHYLIDNEIDLSVFDSGAGQIHSEGETKGECAVASVLHSA
ncbi:hypothetical protein BMS3Abin07_02418 [bacterium BMS3Abin07]|nr:hypothetical protein BMS3Abin07_02418 [bacterium BMS3Abin07]GBE33479.1 hypothetical protein BMS3Bbin05_02420 [bacterium BMS3Bbin05]